MDMKKARSIGQTASSFSLPNGYVLPEGSLTPNALFVGGIDVKVEEHEMWDFFKRFGNVKEVKIITYRGGVCKGYGFVYFSEDVNIQSIVEQQIIFKGRRLKLGPAILKKRIPRSIPTRLVGPTPWTPYHYICCGCCSPVGGGLPQPAPVFSGGSPSNQVYFPCLQPFSYSSFGEAMLPQLPMSYTQSPYPYQLSPLSSNMQYTPAPWNPDKRTQPFHQSFVDSEVQTVLNVL